MVKYEKEPAPVLQHQGRQRETSQAIADADIHQNFKSIPSEKRLPDAAAVDPQLDDV